MLKYSKQNQVAWQTESLRQRIRLSTRSLSTETHSSSAEIKEASGSGVQVRSIRGFLTPKTTEGMVLGTRNLKYRVRRLRAASRGSQPRGSRHLIAKELRLKDHIETGFGTYFLLSNSNDIVSLITPTCNTSNNSNKHVNNNDAVSAASGQPVRCCFCSPSFGTEASGLMANERLLEVLDPRGSKYPDCGVFSGTPSSQQQWAAIPQKVAHKLLKVAPNYRPLDFQVGAKYYSHNGF